MRFGFLFLTDLSAARETERQAKSEWWWVTVSRSRSVDGLCDGTCPAPGSGPGHCDFCLLVACRVASWLLLPPDLPGLHRVHPQQVRNWISHMSPSAELCFPQGACAAWGGVRRKKNHLDLLRSYRHESGYSAAPLHSSATDAEIIGVIWNIKSFNVFRGTSLTWLVWANI